jgi:hypothetical protein
LVGSRVAAKSGKFKGKWIWKERYIVGATQLPAYQYSVHACGTMFPMPGKNARWLQKTRQPSKIFLVATFVIPNLRFENYQQP